MKKERVQCNCLEQMHCFFSNLGKLRTCTNFLSTTNFIACNIFMAGNGKQGCLEKDTHLLLIVCALCERSGQALQEKGCP